MFTQYKDKNVILPVQGFQFFKIRRSWNYFIVNMVNSIPRKIVFIFSPKPVVRRLRSIQLVLSDLPLTVTRCLLANIIINTVGENDASLQNHHSAIDLRCNFWGQPGSVYKFPPFLWVKLWVGRVGRGYIEISRYFPALWINRVTLATKIKLWY